MYRGKLILKLDKEMFEREFGEGSYKNIEEAIVFEEPIINYFPFSVYVRNKNEMSYYRYKEAVFTEEDVLEMFYDSVEDVELPVEVLEKEMEQLTKEVVRRITEGETYRVGRALKEIAVKRNKINRIKRRLEK